MLDPTGTALRIDPSKAGAELVNQSSADAFNNTDNQTGAGGGFVMSFLSSKELTD